MTEINGTPRPLRLPSLAPLLSLLRRPFRGRPRSGTRREALPAAASSSPGLLLFGRPDPSLRFQGVPRVAAPFSEGKSGALFLRRTARRAVPGREMPEESPAEESLRAAETDPVSAGNICAHAAEDDRGPRPDSPKGREPPPKKQGEVREGEGWQLSRIFFVFLFLLEDRHFLLLLQAFFLCFAAASRPQLQPAPC